MLVGSIFLNACSARKGAQPLPQFTPSGFLQDYDLLEPGKPGQASLVYRNPDVDIPAYQKILIDRVTIWCGADLEDHAADSADFVRMANMLYSTFRERFEKTHVITDTPGPSTLRFRLALTDVTPNSSELVVYSTVVPPPEHADDATEVSPTARKFFASATVEAEVTDSETDQLLIEAVTRKFGGRALDGSIETWAEARQVFEAWANTLAERAKAARKQ